jgi:vancomycin resistance protein YoaR
MTYLKPAVLRPDIEKTLFQDELASADTPYYFNPDRTTNLELACKAIHNDLVRPGEVFSFNESLGERTSEKGYKPAGAYVGGETVDQVGGGICQVASTIYYCALYADLEIVEREEHMYTADYLPLGMDATVNWETIDFQFRNNTNYPIRIEANAKDGYVTVRLIGTDDKDYYVEMDYKIIKEYEWETVEKKMKEDNEKGYVDGEVILNGWMGYSVDTYKYKYDKDTDEHQTLRRGG